MFVASLSACVNFVAGSGVKLALYLLFLGCLES